MSTYDWEEVKRLAADFQRAQLTSTSQKLSERNCVEIITKLIQLKLLDVVFTTDGKTYITPKYLIKEIKDELYMHNGRINLIDVSKSLNVDLNVVTSLAQEIIKDDSSVKLILGQLIDHSYVIHVAEEINDKLLQHGLINVTELARSFDLPGDYIHSVIKENCGRFISGIKQDKQDIQSYYTETFLNQNKAIVRGALIAITKPTLISTVISHTGISEHIFFTLIDSLIESKQIPGVVTERLGSICTYIPQIYLKTQAEWVNNFYNQNGYLEYDALTRVGINDPKSFISKSLTCEGTLQYLKNCAVGQQLLDQIEASVEEAVNSHTWINILNVLPTVIDSDDAEIMLHNAIGKHRNFSGIQIFNHTYAVSELFLASIQAQVVEEIISSKVNEAVNSGAYEQYLVESSINNNANNDSERRDLSRKEERKKRANVGKAGGGTQGRETKTKATKKKYGNIINRNDSDDECSKKPAITSSMEFFAAEEIQSIIKADKSFQDEEFDHSKFVEVLVQHLYPILNKIALNLAQTLYETQIASRNNSKRQMNTELQDNIISTYQDLKQYYKGIKEFPDADCQLLLNKYLLKTTGTTLVNLCFNFLSDKNEEINTAEARQKVLANIDNKELKESFSELNKSVNGNRIEDFSNDVESVLSGLNIMMKKMDKKKEKLLLKSHKQALIEKLKESDSPPLILHLVSLILFQTITQSMLNASGRFVSSILSLLDSRLPKEANEVLLRYHKLVLSIFKLNKNDEEYQAINDELVEISPSVKNLVYTVPSE